MKVMFLWLFLCCLSVVPIAAQGKRNTPKSSENYNTVIAGKGIDGVIIGKSTMDDVIKKFGAEYRWIVNKKYSFQMNYYRLGIAFYMCQSDKKKEIFVIEMKAPFKAKTKRGVILGKSTVEEIEKKYGKLKSGLEYRGISFYYNRINGKRVVTEIDITESAGIRQCK